MYTNLEPSESRICMFVHGLDSSAGLATLTSLELDCAWPTVLPAALAAADELPVITAAGLIMEM